ncbi:MAG: 2Fe-2S iron-sulfur cluster-binding protein [Actinomycetota bacterium]
MSDDAPNPSGSAPAAVRELTFTVNGAEVSVPDVGESLLAVLRERLGLTSVKDGCSPQGQCGCCTVLVDGKPRVACVTPARRIRGRSIQTTEGLTEERRTAWGDALCRTGGSQCGFCTPGIVMRLEGTAVALAQKSGGRATGGDQADQPNRQGERDAVNQALLAHLCRCTGWQTIHEAWELLRGDGRPTGPGESGQQGERDLDAAGERAALEGRAVQRVSPLVALGQAGFAADTAPADALIAVADQTGQWVVADTLTEARTAAGKVQGRRTTASHRWPLDVPSGEWAATLRTTWVDGAYLETDASWCVPGGQPFTSVANGGAFGAKSDSPEAGELAIRNVARTLADTHDRPVLVLASREDTAAGAPKRPPVAGGMDPDGRGVLRVVETPGIAEAVRRVAPLLTVEEVPVPGPPTSAALRSAGWAEAEVLLAGATGTTRPVSGPDGGTAEAVVEDGVIKVVVGCGPALDAVVLRSYCIGAAHMAWSWLTSEAMLVDENGAVHDLTIRSFGVLRAVDTPPIEVEIVDTEGPSVNGSDAVFAAVAAAGWLVHDCQPDWPLIESSASPTAHGRSKR